MIRFKNPDAVKLVPQLTVARNAINLLTACLLASLITGAIGCSDSGGRERVTGRVTLDGKPLAEGTVSTKLEKGRGSSGQIQPDGTFTLGHPADGPGAALGTHSVSVVAIEGGTERLDDEEVEISGQIRSLVPLKYNSPRTSGLTIEVTAGGENNFTLELKSTGL